MNVTKYESYRVAFRLLARAERTNDFALAMAAIAIAESIIADRCSSFIKYKDNAWYVNKKGKNGKNFIPTAQLVEKAGKDNKFFKIQIKRNNKTTFKSDQLFEDISEWLKTRNEICHSFAKSEPGTPTKPVLDFEHLSFQTAADGLKYASLVKKWFALEKRKNK